MNADRVLLSPIALRMERRMKRCTHTWTSCQCLRSSIRTGLLGQQQTQQRHPNVPLPRHLLQLLRGDPMVFPGQLGDIVPPACPGPIAN
ncbi:hypothetical protein ATANTOWER_023096 [Ataeniobius toweri]|uniref:Uncharacterized protein n=1 Tax=Ataeniobius toweri TaxID=208326 RepID=A0ABU7B020_9TELE|nr:hypothetical protein [Ataeniobius toweri]